MISSILSWATIALGLAALIVLIYKGCSVLWVAPLAALIVSAGNGLPLLDTYLDTYMKGAGGFFTAWFPAFFMGAIYGTLMDKTGSARAFAEALMARIGSKYALLAVLVYGCLITYGGVNQGVAMFVVYPMAAAMFRSARIRRTLLPGAIAFGTLTVGMTAAGSPALPNLVPTTIYGTAPTAAPLMSLVCAILIGVPGYLFLQHRAGKSAPPLEGAAKPSEANARGEGSHWLAGVVPIVVVVVVLNVLKQHVVVAMLTGSLAVAACNWKQWRGFAAALTEGAKGTVSAIIGTCAAVGFGSVVQATPGFAVLMGAIVNMKGSALVAEAAAVSLMSAITASATGGLSMSLPTLAPALLQKAAESGIDPATITPYLHRIAVVAAGGLDSLPHNGGILTILAVTGCTHKESYYEIAVTATLLPCVVSLLVAALWGFILA